MGNKPKRKLLIMTTSLIIIISSLMNLKKNTPVSVESSWPKYETPEDAGWSSENLEKAKSYYDSIGSTATLVIYNGKVLISWGDTAKKSNIHSIRKSLLSSLYGIHIEEGNIDLQSTLKDLAIHDTTNLTEIEKEAKIEDLLTSRSGVYLRAGEESLAMRWNRPQREIHLPGTYFHYNNWDFNVLGTIFKEKTNSDLFTEFDERIAQRIGMEDFTKEDTTYRFELRRSIHPSYLFRMSARDLARFGQLYLEKGEWEGEQIIPRQWIEQSTIVHTPTPTSNEYGYGYMWWVADSGYFKEIGLYSAIGRYGQSIDIIPEKNLVFVHRVDSDKFLNRVFNHVNNRQRLHLLKLILDAKISE